MKRMDRKHGKWGPTHPRYRLLEALFGFSKYRERNLAELNRWRSLYKNVSKKQKQVRLTDSVISATLTVAWADVREGGWIREEAE